MLIPPSYSGIRLDHHIDGHCEICTSLPPTTGLPSCGTILFTFRRVKEHLGRAIQTGGANVGHSSVEDSVATLDLMKWHVINKPPPPPIRTPKPPPPAPAPASEIPIPTPSPIVASTSASTTTLTPVVTPVSTQMSSTTSATQEEPKPPPTADDIPF